MPFGSKNITFMTHSVKPGSKFNVLQQGTLRRLMNDAQFCLRRAANPNESDQQRSVAIRRWFGLLNAVDIGEVLLNSQRMYAYSTTMREFKFKSHNPIERGSVASFGQHSKHKVAGGILARPTLPDFRWANYINITSLFFVQPHKTQVCSLLHELSHAWIGTKDLALNGKEVYGEEMAVRVINEQSPRVALTSAENWGYYLTEFNPTIH